MHFWTSERADISPYLSSIYYRWTPRYRIYYRIKNDVMATVGSRQCPYICHFHIFYYLNSSARVLKNAVGVLCWNWNDARNIKNTINPFGNGICRYSMSWVCVFVFWSTPNNRMYMVIVVTVSYIMNCLCHVWCCFITHDSYKLRHFRYDVYNEILTKNNEI